MLYDDLSKTIGRVIRNARLSKGMTLDELGKQVGLTKATLCKYESGAINKISPSRIEKLSEILGVPIMEVASTCYESNLAFSNRMEKMQAAKDLIVQCWGKNSLEIFENFNQLTLEGQKKVLVYSNDLLENPRYNQEAAELASDYDAWKENQ